MESKMFYAELSEYVKNNDIENANRVIMHELGSILAKDKGDFIEILKNANILVPENSNEAHLINAFVENAPINRKLLLGASFLIAHKNKKVDFNGVSSVSDTGTKATYKVLHSYFDSDCYKDNSNEPCYDYNYNLEDMSNIWGALIKGGVKLAKNLVAKNKEIKGTQSKQQLAQQQLAQEVLRKKQEEEARKRKEEEKAKKKTQTILIVGGISLALILLGTVIYVNRKK